MKTFRHGLVPSMVGGFVLALPYAFPVGIAWAALTVGMRLQGEELTPGVAIISITGWAFVLSLVPAIFFYIARATWRDARSVVRQHLYAWPIAAALIGAAGLGAALAHLHISLLWLPIWFIAATTLGLSAARLWFAIAYR